MKALLQNISKPLALLAILLMGLSCEKTDNAENYAVEILLLPDDGVVVQARFPNDLSDETWAPMWRTDTVNAEYSVLTNLQARPGADFEDKSLHIVRLSGEGRCRVVYAQEMQLYTKSNLTEANSYNAYRKLSGAMPMDSLMLFLEAEGSHYYHVLESGIDSLVIPISLLDSIEHIYVDSCIVRTNP